MLASLFLGMSKFSRSYPEEKEDHPSLTSTEEHSKDEADQGGQAPVPQS